MVTDAQLNHYLKKLERSPKDVDLLNRIALGYLENPPRIKDQDDLRFFEKAYEIQPTVKSIHNLAWYLYFEACGVENCRERAIALQKQCLELEPKSYFPYALHGYMLLQENQFSQALPVLEIAYQKSQRTELLHNIAYAYFQLQDFERAVQKFQQCLEDDPSGFSLHGLAIAYYCLGNNRSATQCLERLEHRMKQERDIEVDGHHLAEIYAAMGEYEKAYAHAEREGWDCIDMVDWTGIAFSVFCVNPTQLSDYLEQSIVQRKQWIDQIETGHENYSDDTEDEKQERLTDYRREIEIREGFVNTFTAGKPDIELIVWPMDCGCLLFDCDQHKNPAHDSGC